MLAHNDSDEAFCNLYDGVADIFAGLLKSDQEHLHAGDTDRVHRQVVPVAAPVVRLRDAALRGHRALSLPARLEPRVPRYPRQSVRLPRPQPAPPRGAGAAPQGARAPRGLHERRKWDELPCARLASTAIRRYKWRPGCSSFFWASL